MILIYGKGKVGNGLANFLQHIGTRYEITDDATLAIEKGSTELTEEQKIYFSQFEQIIVSPGVPPHHPVYIHFGDKIISELNFLGTYLEKNNLRDKFIIIGITGTNGKSTTTHINYQALNTIFTQHLPQANIQVHLSGNFGTPFSETLTNIDFSKDTKHVVVMECSSFMLYKLHNFKFDYSILTNIETDHLDRHPDKEDYQQAKLNLISFTNMQAFTTPKVYEVLPTDLKNITQIFDYTYDLKGTNFMGHHNKANLQSAYLLNQRILSDLGYQNINIKDILAQIHPLEHRMQLYTSIDGVNIFDDGICTSSHAQENALKGLDKKVVLICGGYDKGDSFDHLADLYKEKVSHGIFIGLTAPKFEKIFAEKNIPYNKKDSLHEAIQSAFSIAKDTTSDLLFSPGCASFDMFRNVYHRIEEFEKEIKLLQENN